MISLANLANLTTPQRCIVERLQRAGKALAAADLKVASPSYTGRVVRELHEKGAIHIAAWRRAADTNNGLTALFLWGAGPDAPKPTTDPAELRRRKQARDNARKARSNETALPPALPAKAAGIGIWGL
jgi:hypothetical protein